jgi:hypothetical protein
MCSVAFAMAAAQTATTYMAQKQAAEAQEAVQQRATINENKRHLLEMGTVRLRQAQEDVASAQKISENQRAANIAFATATTAAAPGAGGVSGLSVSALLGGIMQGQARRDVSILQQQRAADLGRFVAMRDAGNRTTQNYLRINKPIKRESILEAAMAGVQTGLSTQQAISSFA